MSARHHLLRGGAAFAVVGAALVLGACDLIIKAAYGDRHVDPRVTCASGECVCVEGFGDCDGDADNGCEADLSEAPNCGACGHACTNGTCSSGVCSCDTGFDDCDGDPGNGCEAPLDGDPQNCGVCGLSCDGGACHHGACP